MPSSSPSTRGDALRRLRVERDRLPAREDERRRLDPRVGEVLLLRRRREAGLPHLDRDDVLDEAAARRVARRDEADAARDVDLPETFPPSWHPAQPETSRLRARLGAEPGAGREAGSATGSWWCGTNGRMPVGEDGRAGVAREEELAPGEERLLPVATRHDDGEVERPVEVVVHRLGDLGPLEEVLQRDPVDLDRRPVGAVRPRHLRVESLPREGRERRRRRRTAASSRSR